MAPATRERISTRSTASSRPENSSHGTVSRGTTTDTETGRAAGAATAVSAWALPGRSVWKLIPPATANSAGATASPAKALDLALQVFWRKGYEGASMADLTETMGITKPSLYSAFGNKEELFRKALDRYVDGPGGYVQVALGKPAARAVVEHLLYGASDAVTDPDHPPGCLAVQGALSCGDAAESIKQEVISRPAKGRGGFRKEL